MCDFSLRGVGVVVHGKTPPPYQTSAPSPSREDGPRARHRTQRGGKRLPVTGEAALQPQLLLGGKLKGVTTSYSHAKQGTGPLFFGHGAAR